MSDNWDVNDDDLDFDDLDLLMDENEEVSQDRSPAQRVAQGALDSILSRDNAKGAAKTMMENALPAEYKEAVSAGQDGIDTAIGLYDEAKEEFKKPIDEAKKLINRNVDKLPSFIDDSIKEKIRSATQVEERPDSLTKERDIDAEALQAALTTIFEQGQQQIQVDAQKFQSESAQDQASTEATLSAAGRTNQLLGRLVGYQDTIGVDAQRKSLELQHLQYYALRDILKVTRGSAEDQQTANQALIKNTSLPDFVKMRRIEGYQSVALQDIYGKANETISDFTSNFRSRLVENIGNKTKEWAGSLSELTDAAVQGEDAASMAGDMGGDPMETAGGVGAGLVQDFLVSKAGKMLRKKLEKNPKVAEYAQDIEYALASYPREVSYFLRNWDGGVLPPEMVERFPWLEKVNLAFLTDTLQDINVLADSQELTFAGSLRKEGQTAVPFDNLTRRSIIEIIPGYLSRILEQVTKTNNPDAERMTYSIDREGFVGVSQLAAETDASLFKRQAEKRTRTLKTAVDDINEEGLSKATEDKLGQVLLNFALENKPVRLQEIFEDDSFTNLEKDELERFVMRSDRSKKQLRNILAAAIDDMSRGQKEMQESINELYGLGQMDALRESGIVKDGEFKDQQFLSKEATDKIRQVAKENKGRFDKEKLTEDNFTQAELDEILSFTKDKERGKNFTRAISKIDFDSTERSIREGFEKAMADFNKEAGTINSEVDNTLVNRRSMDISTPSADQLANKTDGLMGRLNKTPNATDTQALSKEKLEAVLDVNSGQVTNYPEPIDYTSILDRILTSMSNLPTTMFDVFSRTVNKDRAVPVFMVDGEGGVSSQGPPSDSQSVLMTNSDTTSQSTGSDQPNEPGFTFPTSIVAVADTPTESFRNSLLSGMSEMSQMLAQVVINTSTPQSAETEVKSKPGFLTSAYTSTMDMVGKYVGGVYKAAGGIVGGGLSGGGSIIGGGLSMLGGGKKNQPQDIMMEGSKEPVLEANKLARGEYIDAETGNVIRSLEDIQGEVIDRAGNVVISSTDAGKDFYTRSGEKLDWLKNLLGTPFNMVGGYYRLAGNLVSGAWEKSVNLLVGDKAKDVYVKGETFPRLRGFVMKNGGYFSATTGKPITTVGQIDGPVVDHESNLLLGHEELQQGLVDVHGNPIDGTRIGNMARRGIDIGKAMFSRAGEAMGGIKEHVASTVGGVRDSVLNRIDGQIDPQNTEGLNVPQTTTEEGTTLADILGYLKTRWPMEESGPLFDSDDDGDRDNSLADIMSRRKEKQAEREEETERAENGEGVWGKLFEILMMIAPAITGLGGIIGGWASKLLTALGLKKAVDVGSDMVDGDLPEGEGRDKKGKRNRRGRKAKGKKGLFGKAWRGIKKGGKGLAKLAGKAAPVAGFIGRKAGGFLARGVATAAAAATGVVSAPVVATAATVAGVAYTGYQAYKFFSSRADAEPLERLRFLQYGLNPDTTDHLVKIRELESNVEDEIKWSGSEPKLGISIQDAANEWAEDFGVNTSSEREMKLWANWFAKRFLPIYMTHVSALRKIAPDADIDDVDDDVEEPGKKLEFLNAVTLKTEFRKGKDPLAIVASPIPGYVPSTNEAAITSLTDKLRTEYGNKVDSSPKGFEGKIPDPKDPRGGTQEANAIKEYESKSPKRPDKTKTAISVTGRGGVVTRKSTAPQRIMVSTDSGPKQAGKFLIRPVRENYRISSPFGTRVHPISGRRKIHKGMDFAAPRGTPIYSAAAGTISRRAYSNSYGNVIYIDHYNGTSTRYAHMDRFEPGLSVGDVVPQGKLIGFVGNTGASAGNHLHFRLNNSKGKAVNPADYIGERDVKEEIAKQEKEAKEEAKDVESKDETIEGRDTIQSTVENKAVVENTNRNFPTPDSKETDNQSKKQTGKRTGDPIRDLIPTKEDVDKFNDIVPSGKNDSGKAADTKAKTTGKQDNGDQQSKTKEGQGVETPPSSQEVEDLKKRLDQIQTEAKSGKVNKQAVSALSKDLASVQSRMHKEAQTSRHSIADAINKQNALLERLVESMGKEKPTPTPQAASNQKRAFKVADLLGQEKVDSSIDLSNN